MHTVTFSDSSVSDPSLQPGSTWEVQFSTPGSYLYRCTAHPGMQGTVVSNPADQPVVTARKASSSVATAPAVTHTTS